MRYENIVACFFLFSLFFVSCNMDSRKLSEEEILALQRSKDDSIAVIIDSLNSVNIYVPPLYDERFFDSGAVTNFCELATKTKGELKILVNSKLLTNEIVRIIKDKVTNDADFLLLIDKTSSMADDIDVVKKGLEKIISEISQFKNVRLGIAMYGDKNEDGDDWFSFKDFGTNYSEAKAFVENIEVTGGGDWPESVYDAFFKIEDYNFWRSGTKRMTLLIGDACSLEKPLSDHTLSDVINKANEHKIITNFYPIIVTPASDEDADGIRNTVIYNEGKLISKLYPNPSSGEITVTFEKDDEYMLYVFDNNGRSVYSEKFTGNTWTKDLSWLHTGAFVLRAIGKNTTFESMKFIIL